MKKRLGFLILLCLLSGYNAMAQFDDDDLPPTDEPPVPAAPVDRYIPLLLVAGAVYAVRRIKAKKKNGVKP